MNGNNTVVKKVKGLKSSNPLLKVNEATIRDDFFKRKAIDLNHQRIEKDVEDIERKSAYNEVGERIAENANYMPRLLNRIEVLRTTGRDMIVKDILFEFFNKSLIIDKDFKDSAETSLRSILESFVDERGGYNGVKAAYESSKSLLLKAILETADYVSRRVCERKLTEARTTPTEIADIKFTLNDQEKEDLNYQKGDLSIDQIADLVKNKVLTVIKDEKNRQQKESELDSDLEAQAQADNITVKEAADKYIIGKLFGTLREGTLFNAIQHNSYKTMLESVTNRNHASRESTDDNDDDNDDVAHFNEADVTKDEFTPFTIKELNDGEYNLQRERNETDIDDESSIDEDELSIDMDLVMAESLTKYTLMEMAFALKLESYKAADIKNIAQRLLN